MPGKQPGYREMHATYEANIDSSAASSFLAAVFEWFDGTELKYCVQRNYEGYPDTLTGDVDLVVADGQMSAAVQGIQSVACRMGWHCYVGHVWQRAAYLGFGKSIFPDRFALTIELFAGAGWHGLVYLPASEILSSRIRHGVTWRPLAAHQAIITATHHLLYNGHVPHKYRHEIRSLSNEDPQAFGQALSRSFGDSLAELISDSVAHEDWDVLVDRIASLKLALMKRSFRTPLTTAANVWQGYQALRRVPEGLILFVYGDDKQHRDNLCNALLRLADRWHIFLPPSRKMISCETSSVRMKKRNRGLVHRVVRRGGVAIISCSMSMINDLRLSYPPYAINCVEGRCSCFCLEGTDSFQDATKCVVSSMDVTRSAHEIWNYVLTDRAHRDPWGHRGQD